MPKEVIMPQMGESVAEGTILRWLINEGEHIEKDQPLVEISTDKVDTEVPSPVSGVLKKILHQVDDTVPVGTVIAMIEEEAEGIKPSEPAKPVIPKEELEEKIEEREPREKRYSPLVRRLAREYGVDLDKMEGTGAGGRITKEDVLEYVGGRGRVTEPQVEEVKEVEKAREEIIPLSAKRKIIAERMAESKRTAPHVTATFEVDMSSVAKHRESNKEVLRREQGVHLTYLPYIISAAASALKEYPLLNSSWTEEGIVIKRYVNIGMAVAVEDGLIVPVIKDADKKDIIELARESQDLARRSREKRLKVEEVQGGTFTITNYGITGSLFGTPIIMPPQVAILGTGTINKRPVVINDAIAIRWMMYLSLSFDHRVIDGAQADQFLSRIKAILEGWGGRVEKMPAAESGFGGVW